MTLMRKAGFFQLAWSAYLQADLCFVGREFVKEKHHGN